MYILNFETTTSRSFAHGFLKGLAAPVMLYHTEAVPAVKHVEFITAPSVPLGLVLVNDWLRIGSDFNNVIEREYGKQPTKAFTKKAHRKRR